MKAIDRIIARLDKYPKISYTREEGWISMDPPTDTGFTVWFREKRPGFTVGFDGWHEEFDDEDEALSTVALGLSDHSRLEVIKRGKMECCWTVEWKDGRAWIRGSATCLIFFPFWKKKYVEYRRNRFITAMGQTCGGE